jgi:hypothetical protein
LRRESTIITQEHIEGFGLLLSFEVKGIKYHVPLREGLYKIADKKDEVARLEIEQERVKKALLNVKTLLANERFMVNTTAEKIYFEKLKLEDLEKKNHFYSTTLMRLKCGKEYNWLLKKFGTEESLRGHIEYLRENKTTSPQYYPDWFKQVYSEEIKAQEIIQLYDLLNS